MKSIKLTVVAMAAIAACVLSSAAYADWDPVLEAREAAARKAEQQRVAKKRAEHDKMIREATMKCVSHRTGVRYDGPV